MSAPCGLHGGRRSCSTYRLTTAHHRPLMQLRPLGQARHTGQAVIRAAPPCLTAGTRPLSWPVRFPAPCRGVCRTRRILSLLFPCLYIFIVCTYLSLPVCLFTLSPFQFFTFKCIPCTSRPAAGRGRGLRARRARAGRGRTRSCCNCGSALWRRSSRRW